MSAGEPVSVTARYETWSSYQATVASGSLQWFRRLPEVNARRQRDMKAQGVLEFADKVPDPLSGLTVGGRIWAPDMVDAGAGTGKFNTLKTKTCALKTAAPVRQLDLCITLRMEQDKSQATWEEQLTAERAAGGARRQSRSHRRPGVVGGVLEPQPYLRQPRRGRSRPGLAHGRNYQLFRYQLAANRNGRAMTLFNGGMFVCEGNPDGPCGAVASSWRKTSADGVAAAQERRR